MTVEDVGGVDGRDLQPALADRGGLHEEVGSGAVAVEHAGQLALAHLVELGLQAVIAPAPITAARREIPV